MLILYDNLSGVTIYIVNRLIVAAVSSGCIAVDMVKNISVGNSGIRKGSVSGADLAGKMNRVNT